VRRKLELERTINSMSLAAEREILKKIHKLNICRRQLCEKKQHDQQIKQHKVAVSTLRDTLKEKRSDISELKIELSTVQTAVALGCEVKDLLGKKMECPTDKIGTILGKKGKNVQEIMLANNVDVQIVKDQGDIHLIGSSLESLDAVVAELEKAMTTIEKSIEISSSLHHYLTAANITLLSTLRLRNPNTIIEIKRIKVDELKVEKGIRNVRVRGNPADLDAFESELMNIECVTKDVTVSSSVSGLLVGKAGKNIEEMVNEHQVAIDVYRPARKEDSAEVGEGSAKVTICGPPPNVETVLAVIDIVVEANRDHEELISLESIVKAVLLQNNGAGIQSLQKAVNAETKNITEGTTSNSILINIKGKDLVVKGKAKVMDMALPCVNAEIERLTSMIVKMQLDELAVPALIGKGGQGIKKLTDGTTSVQLEIHAKLGEVEICGLKQNEVNKVVAATQSVIDSNQVQRIRLDCDDSSSTNSFSVQFRNLSRSVTMKQIKELVVLSADNDTKELAIRGTSEKLLQASRLIQEFLDSNFMEELVVSTEDISSLLTGGKTSKIAELTSSTGVNLSADKERNAIVGKGEKSKVLEAIQAVREFLYGSVNVIVRNIAMADEASMGVIIGKSGKSMADLRQKFPSVSIIVHRTDAAITLRGDTHQVEQCHDEIVSRLSIANITRKVDLTSDNIADASTTKFIKRLGPIATVKVDLNIEDGYVSFRGYRSDVHAALTALNENLTGVFECQWYIGSAGFRKFYGVCNKSNHLNQQSGAKVYLNEKFEVIVISGTRETVKAAKNGMLTFFDFVFEATMSKLDIPAAAFPMMGTSAFTNKVVAATGVTLLADQDTSSILLFSTTRERLNEATLMINEKLDAVENLIIVWQFTESEEWMMSLFVGKKGERIRNLRKETNCTIEVNPKERRITLSASDKDVVTKGKEIVDNFVSKARKECASIHMSSIDLPAFIGKLGKNMKSFMEEHGVKLELVKKDGAGTLLINGSEGQVAAAQQAVFDWQANRVELRKEAEGEITKNMKPRDIPAIIGTKGETIRSVQKEFGCKVIIDRDALTYTVTGGSSMKRLALTKKLDSIVEQNDATKKMARGVTPEPIEYIGNVVVVESAEEVNTFNKAEQLD
jgi:KH domain